MSALNSILQKARTDIEAQRKAELEREKQKAMTEKVVPQNTAIDVALKEAIDEERKKVEERISQIRSAFDAEVAQLTHAAQYKKDQTMQAEMANVECVVNAKYNVAIDRLNKLIEEAGE